MNSANAAMLRLLVTCSLLALLPSSAEARQPSVLVHCARADVSQWYWWVDLDYLKDLHQQGFEVDYTDRHSDFTWERVRQHDVLVIYSVPLQKGKYFDNSPDTPPYRDAFIEVVERFLDSGGGLLLMARSINGDESFRPLIERWGARIPYERIVEDDPENLRPMPRMRGIEKLWFTDGVADTPVSEGVRQVWLPITEHYFAAETMPIEVSPDWTVVLRGGRRSRTIPIDSKEALARRPPGARVREGGVPSPDLFAIRDYKKGRLAFGAIWPQYSIGQGTRWLYERRVLSRGLDGRESHFGKLLENTLRWLAAPRLAASPQTGFVTDPERLLAPNLRPGVRERFVEGSLRSPLDGSKALARARGARIQRGLIGATTGPGGGEGSVAEYAEAARAAGLDFVVFLERFGKLDPAEFERLKADCLEHSDEDLQLYPGYRLETNTGNRIFLFGPEIELLPPELIYRGRLNLQYRDPETGTFLVGHPFQSWMMRSVLSRGGANVGYYGFSDHPKAMPLEDLRLYSVVALRLFRNGKRIEDNLPAYLRSATGTFPAAPVAVHLLEHPKKLREAGEHGTGLTYVRADSTAELRSALSYANLFRSPGLFTSDGPLIETWPQARQYYTFAAEDFVARAARLPSPIAVRSDVGLREIRIYQGERLFRRYLCDGSRRFEHVLELSASAQKTLTLVAEDVNGGVAVSSALRAWKGGDMTPVFCGDRINHCTSMPLLAKGPGSVQVSVTPSIEAGHTWDGGPQGRNPLLRFLNAHRPALRSSKGEEGLRGFNNFAFVELADEGAVRVTSRLETLYDARIPVINAWNTYGPLDGPSHLFRSTATLTVFDRPVVGPAPEMYPGTAVKSGATISLFENRITFLKKQEVETLKLFRQNPFSGPFPVTLVHLRDGARVATLHLAPPNWPKKEIRFLPGDWIGIHGPDGTNSSFHLNRGEALRLRFRPGDDLSIAFDAELAEPRVKRDEVRRYELLSVVDPVDAWGSRDERLRRVARYLDRPGGLELLRGSRIDGSAPQNRGLLELEADDGAVALRLRAPSERLNLPLPLRVSGLNPRWSAGVLLIEGYVLGNYEPRHGKYREAALDREGRAYFSIFPDRADRTELVLGHPVVCDRDELFIQVTRLDDLPAPGSWSVTLNNPTEREIVTRCRVAFEVPGLALETREYSIPAGAELALID